MNLLRNLAAVVLGVVTMGALTFLLPVLIWLILGPDGSFQPGSWEVSGLWNASWIVVAFVAAAAAGFVCDRLATGRIALRVLIGIAVASSIYSALYYMPAAVGEVRPDDVAMFDAMAAAQSPIWIAWLNLPLSVAGLVVGARWRRKA